MGQNRSHAYAVQVLLTLLAKIFGIEQIRVQLAMEAATAEQERTLPEPDFAILAKPAADYRRRHPRSDEMLLVVEVADTTIRYDSTIKRGLYARADVREYWVVDLGRRRLWVHRSPAGSAF